MNVSIRYIFFIYLFFIPFILSGQEGKRIKVISADKAEFDSKSGNTAKRLIGNVAFRHENALMYCDSAWLYSETNSIDAYGNVRIEQGDSVKMRGRFMSYNGNTRIARVRDSVILIHKDSKLFTDSLNYNRRMNFAYFFNGGKILHEDIDLKSERGYYYPDIKNYFAVDSAVLIHPDYKILSDSLKYNTERYITYFLDSTKIINDSSVIICQYGWYDEENKTSAFGKNTRIYQDAQKITADSVFYNRQTGSGRAWKDVYLIDTAEQFAGSGNYAEYSENFNESFLTDSALAMYYENNDTTYIHGDTIFISKDSLNSRVVSSYYKVQIFKTDLRGRCDSLIYRESDSIARMFINPVLWAEESQITADTIELYLKNNKAEKILMKEESFVAMQEDSVRFSQISGENITAWIKNNELSKIYVPSNAKTIYYLRDDKTKDIIGVNKEVSSEMRIYRNDGVIERIDFITNPDGELLPDDHTTPSQMRLPGFKWLGDIKPRTINDLFIWK